MIHTVIRNINLDFNTDNSIFSPREMDFGTLAMLNSVTFNKKDKVLDLGCGYGIVGILASKIICCQNVVMCDIDSKAVELSKENAFINGVNNIRILQSDGVNNIPDKDFSLILSNPPYHTDFSLAKRFIEGGFNKLIVGGKMVMVTRRKEWYKNKFISVFGGVRIIEEKGYFVFLSEKKEEKIYYKKLKNKMKTGNKDSVSKKLKRKNKLKRGFIR